MKKRQKPRQESGKSGKSKKVAMVLTEVGLFAPQIKTYSLNSSMTFTMELPHSLQCALISKVTIVLQFDKKFQTVS